MKNTLAAKAGDVRVEGGRVLVKCIDHEVFGSRWIRRSWLVWWRWRRQLVPKGWVLHHKDKDPSHDVMSNLQLMTNSAHMKLHNSRGEVGNATWTAVTRKKASAYAKAQHKAGKLGPQTWTAESYIKMRAAVTGFKHTPEARASLLDWLVLAIPTRLV